MVSGGKGGIGKLMVVINFVVVFRKIGVRLILVDFDVEVLNDYIFLGVEFVNEEFVN